MLYNIRDIILRLYMHIICVLGRSFLFTITCADIYRKDDIFYEDFKHAHEKKRRV